MSNGKGYGGEGMTVEKLNGETAERRLFNHRFPGFLRQIRNCLFFVENLLSSRYDLFDGKEVKSGPALLSKIGGRDRRFREP